MPTMPASASWSFATPVRGWRSWRFTLGANTQALKLLAAFERQQARLEGRADDEEPADDDSLAARELQSSPSTWVLLRLGRFARPYRKQLIIGFALTLASTAATLVPPYLTIPLMDKVLIPFQAGQRIDPQFVLLLLAGLLGSALLAWSLGWARTWLLALVSERMAADLRTAAFEHLLSLSLDYFGAKRTGDLMARIGSETDRISVFLSLHALDFVTDVLMIGMTAVILFSIDPWLALATLVPLPFIAWMIHVVRDRLRTGFEKIDRVWGDVTNVLADTIPGIRVVKAFAQEGREAARFREANRLNLAVNDKLNKTWSLFTPTVSLLTDIGLLVVWAFGIWQVSRGQITVGVLTAFIAYIGRFYTRLDSMSRIVSVTQKAAAGAKRIFDILDHVSNVPEPVQPDQDRAHAGPHRAARRGFPLRQPQRHPRPGPGDPARRDDRPGGPQRLGQEHAGQPDLPLLRRHRRRHPGRRRRPAPLRRGRLPAPHRPGAAGALPVLRHRGREHRLRQARGATAPRSSPPHAPRMRTSSSCACRRATTRWSASAARGCRAASASASASRARC